MESCASSACAFEPKRATGPLRLWCVHCNEHSDAHGQAKPSTSQPPPPTVTQPAPSAAPEHPNAAPTVEAAQLQQGSHSQCVVFDFDKTLSSKHVGFMDVSSASVAAERCFGGQARVQMLQELFRQIADRGVRVVVLTRNSAHIVQKALAAVSLAASDVIGDERFEMDVPKSVILRQGVMDQGSIPTEGVVFVDDDAGNIRDVAQNVGCHCHYVNNVGRRLCGIDQSDCEAVLAALYKH